MSGPWLAAHEGWYGPPLEREARIDLVGWLAAHGYDGYAYSPKDDPHHRAHWREPYPAGSMAHFRELHEACDGAGLDLVAMVSPGLDWRGDRTDLGALVAKLAAFRELGVRALSVNWDDVPGEGPAAGASHGAAVAHAVDRIGADLRWMATPVDYAITSATPYLRAFAAELPDHVGVVWTGTSVVARDVTVGQHRGLTAELGRPVHFAENFPVNDLGMSDVLHLGPYPQRDPGLRDEVGVVTVNFMHRPLASRVGLAVAAAFWRGDDDREAAWSAAVAEHPGLEPLARACRSWVTEPGPDATLAGWAASGDPRLRAYLLGGCRDGLDPALADELAPWLDRWDEEAASMVDALDVIGSPAVDVAELWSAAGRWARCRRPGAQVFGTRFARYPVTARDGDALVASAGAVVHGENLTDRIWTVALAALP
jgi:hypothetical protein